MRTMLLTLFAIAVCTVAVAGESFPNRMDQAREGEWVLMREVSSADSDERVRMTVTKVADGKISVRREHLDADGKIFESKDYDLTLESYNQRMEGIKSRARSITNEFLVINDTEFDVVAVEFTGESKTADGEERDFKIWFSEKLPIGGIAKIWSSDPDFPSAEVVDFGF